jgi:DNA-binding response OmpR family regulator
MSNKFHVLLIEDDTAVATSLLDALQQSGYATSVKSRGREGGQSAQEGHPHLNILDIRLPSLLVAKLIETAVSTPTK